ncbi:MAG: hypothetical protein JXR25_14540 [Pontiellaceae bacterium]|nr:hypothetical protein [Pontiellaceae bacterium]
MSTYPDPPNAVASEVFSLSVDGTPVTVMDYMNYHYAHFAFDGSISVTVKTSETISTYKISPKSLGIEGQVTDGTNLTFSLTQAPDTNSTPLYLVLQINNLEKLVLLGDPPETDVPAATGTGIFNVVTGYGADNTGATYTQPALQNAINAASSYGTPGNPGIVFVPPGIYKVRTNLLLEENVDFYLAPGSVLKADDNIANYSFWGDTIDPVLVVNDAENVTIRGRGEVDASGIELMDLLSLTPPVFQEDTPEHPRRRIIRTCANSWGSGTSRNVVIEGIVCKDATGWSVELKRTLGITAQNIKVLNHKNINWKIQNDGINVCSSSDALVNQCFVMTIDDAFCSKATDSVMGSMDRVLFANSVMWGWAAGVKGGMQNNHPMNDVVFRNIDLVHCRRAIALDTKTSQDIGQTIPIENVLFDQIRSEELEGHWSIGNHDAVQFDLQDAGANNITIRNFTCLENRPVRCGGYYPANNVTFESFVMNSIPITTVSQIELLGNQPINNLVFTTAKPIVVLSGPASHTNASFEVTATFSEPVTGLDTGDFVVTNAMLSALAGGPSVYTLTVTPTSPEAVSLLLPGGVVQNDSSTDNLASGLLNIPWNAGEVQLPPVSSGTPYLHLKADDIGLADGAGVTTWTDSIGSKTFTGTATYAANYANGYAGVRFDGVSQWMENASLGGATPNVGSLSLFVVGNFGGAAQDGVTDYMIAGQYPDGSANNRLRITNYHEEMRLDVRVGNGDTLTEITTLDTDVHVYSIVSTGEANGTWDLAIDGHVLGTGSNGTSPGDMAGLSLGANKGGSFFDGTIAEVLIYDGGLNTEECGIVQDYLTRKYFGHVLDTDMDSVSDVWERDNFGDLTSSSGGGDNYDGDIQSDAEEWIAGTDPTDPDSVFTLALGRNNSGDHAVFFFGAPGRTYTLETTDDLTRSNGWVKTDTLTSLSSAGEQTFTLDTTSNGFTRVRVSL